jgi:transcriptional regulator with XRE-family HTH domain
MGEERKHDHPALRLVAGTDLEARTINSEEHRDSKRECSLTADIPFGSKLLPVAMSPTVEGDKSHASPISESVMPDVCSERTFEDQDCSDIDMTASLRDAVGISQRSTVTGHRISSTMRPPDLPRFVRVGERIRYWREKRGLSRNRLARMVGAKGYSTISDIELGNTLQPTSLHKYAKALKVSVMYLETDQWEDVVESASRHDGAMQLFDVDSSRLEELTSIEREFVSMKINAILDQIEMARPRVRKSIKKPS